MRENLFFFLKNWTYGPCKDGDQIQKEFVDLWYRFAHKYKDICHFGFTFVTTLTHEVGLTLETLDEYLTGRLAQLHLSGLSLFSYFNILW